ncbi:MAG: hypothetical protein Q7K55_08770 [Candidatus Levybacteria bacterium]|nr:hypothetical protein [Candidatus Levybacteria bacterium]
MPGKINNLLDFLKSGKALNLVVLLVIVAAIPLTVFIAQKQQETRQRASEMPPITPPFPTVIDSNSNVYILEDDGSVDTNDGIRFDKIAQLFYRQYPDKYDFLAIFSSFKPKNDLSAAGLHSNVQNEVRGICQSITKPDEVLWGSTKLKGMQQYPYNDDNYYSTWLSDNNIGSGGLLLEETAHQWLTSVGKKYNSWPPGNPPDGINKSCLETNIPLLLEDDMHWSKGLTMPENIWGAFREARPWIDNGDGTFSYDPKLREKPRKFHPFDLYLMGFADKSEVKGDYLLLTDIDNPDTPEFPPPVSITPGPRVGLVTTHAKSTKVSIDDIIKIAGEERSPSAKDSQKDFQIAFVILTKKDLKPSEIMIKAINNAANIFPGQWAYATGYRSTMNMPTSMFTPTPAPFICTACAADINKSGRVDSADYQRFLTCSGKKSTDKDAYKRPCLDVDINKDGMVNSLDYNCLIKQINQICNVYALPTPTKIIFPTRTNIPATPFPTKTLY